MAHYDGMVEAHENGKIAQLEAENAQLKAELAQAQQKLDKWERVEMLDKELFRRAPADLTAECYHNAANVARQMEERWKQATQREARLREVLRDVIDSYEVADHLGDVDLSSARGIFQEKEAS